MPWRCIRMPAVPRAIARALDSASGGTTAAPSRSPPPKDRRPLLSARRSVARSPTSSRVCCSCVKAGVSFRPGRVLRFLPTSTAGRHCCLTGGTMQSTHRSFRLLLVVHLVSGPTFAESPETERRASVGELVEERRAANGPVGWLSPAGRAKRPWGRCARSDARRRSRAFRGASAHRDRLQAKGVARRRRPARYRRLGTMACGRPNTTAVCAPGVR